MIILRNKEFSSKAQKARRAKWDKKVAKDVLEKHGGRQLDEEKATQIGRRIQRATTVNLDNKGKATVNHGIFKIQQDLTKRGNNEILKAIEGEKKLDSGAFKKIVDRAYRLSSSIISNTARKDLSPADKLNKAMRTTNLQGKLIGRQTNLEILKDRALEKAKKDKRLKENLKKGGKIALATGGAIAAGYGLKKLIDKKKDDSSKLRNKTYSSKAQKARRRVYDLQRGSSARYAYLESQLDGERLSSAQSQDKMIGRKKTMDLIKKGEDSITGSSKGILNKTISYDTTKVKNKKELEEINRARDLLRAGRNRNRDRLFPRLYEGKKDNVNHTINMKSVNKNYILPDARKEAVEQSKIINPKRVKESIAKHEAKSNELRAKKLAGEKLAKNLKTAGKVGLGVAGVAGIGYGIKKAIDKKKKEDKK